MNLDGVLQEASIIDHNWLNEEVDHQAPDGSVFDFDAIKNPNNVKPELEIQWGGGAQQVDFNEPAGVVERNLPDDAASDAEDVIIFARDQMNRGRMGKELVSIIRQKFSQASIRMAANGLRELFGMEGIIGCFAVDGRGYKNCREALKAAQNSPYKRSIRYVIGCQCGDPQRLPVASKGGLMDNVAKVSSGNPMDDFLADTVSHRTGLVSHCRSTMLPILADDLDPSEVDSGMIDMLQVTQLPESETKQLRANIKSGKYGSNKAALQAIFRRAQAAKEAGIAGKYADAIDNTEFMMDQADNQIEFEQPPMADIEVDEQAGLMDVEPPDVLGQQEVDMAPLLEEEFAGTDVIDFNEIQEAPGSIDVDMGQSPDEEDITF